MTLTTIYLKDLLARAKRGEASMGELLNAKRMIAENYGDCDGDLELKDIVDALGGFWEKTYDTGSEIVGNITESAGDIVDNIGETLVSIIDSVF